MQKDDKGGDLQFSGDSLINAIYQGIKKGIQVTYDNQCYGACLILIYCGANAMAYLDMPLNQKEVHGEDFIKWAEYYLSPNLSNQATRITGEELYNARCAMVHTYSVESQKTNGGSIRIIGYVIGGNQSIVWNPKVASNMILLEIETLKDAFFTAIDRFLIKSYADKQKQPILEIRLKKLVNTYAL